MIIYPLRRRKLASLALLPTCMVSVLVQQRAAASNPDPLNVVPLHSYHHHTPEAEQLVVAELVSLKESEQNHARAARLLTILAEVRAQQGKNTEADFLYQMAIECWREAAQELASNGVSDQKEKHAGRSVRDLASPEDNLGTIK